MSPSELRRGLTLTEVLVALVLVALLVTVLSSLGTALRDMSVARARGAALSQAHVVLEHVRAAWRTPDAYRSGLVPSVAVNSGLTCSVLTNGERLDCASSSAPVTPITTDPPERTLTVEVAGRTGVVRLVTLVGRPSSAGSIETGSDERTMPEEP